MNEDDYVALFSVLAEPDIMQYYPYIFDEKQVNDYKQEYRTLPGIRIWLVGSLSERDR